MGKNSKTKAQNTQQNSKAKAKAARKTSDLADDTPKAFRRLMHFQKTGKRPNGLDDGNSQPPGAKRKRASNAVEARVAPTHKPLQEWEAPKIQPDEHMSDFRARVNRELPISGLVNRGKKIGGLKGSQTRTEKKIQRKIALWREEEARRKDKVEEERDLTDQDDAAELNMSDGLAVAKRDRYTKKTKHAGQDEDPDPWERLKVDRGQRVALHDVVQAPPDFKHLPMHKFKIKEGARVDVANVPGHAGSLRQREKLGDTRRDIIESYRKTMGSRRSAGCDGII